MALIVSFLALTTALGALWMASNALKNTEENLQEFTNNILRENEKNRKSMMTEVTKTSKSLADIKKNAKNATEQINSHSKAIKELQLKVAMLEENLSDLDQSIPKQYRKAKPVKKSSK